MLERASMSIALFRGCLYVGRDAVLAIDPFICHIDALFIFLVIWFRARTGIR